MKTLTPFAFFWLLIAANAHVAFGEATWNLDPTEYHVQSNGLPYTPQVNYGNPNDTFTTQILGGGEVGGKTWYNEVPEGNATFLNFVGWYNSSNVTSNTSATWRFSGTWEPNVDGDAEVFMGVNFSYFQWRPGIERIDITMRHLAQGTEPISKSFSAPGTGTEEFLRLSTDQPYATFDFSIEVEVHGLAPALNPENPVFGAYIGSEPTVAVPAPMASVVLGLGIAALGRRRR